ncbi:hypothetical protein L226DRAFT_306502 [Lentinus tigrinus ALCF2SS1-7]|uniref:uncharacterized protein n=1 Tax=Lentinus tigrinus ALCF2SS1-7 TaxID=1328758 RepID=UPI00116635D8|nr:hypothetical protein L226DRAFT_306502 [Lentinus tigrinus ALCF2SS1-7]
MLLAIQISICLSSTYTICSAQSHPPRRREPRAPMPTAHRRGCVKKGEPWTRMGASSTGAITGERNLKRKSVASSRERRKDNKGRENRDEICRRVVRCEMQSRCGCVRAWKEALGMCSACVRGRAIAMKR